MISTTLGMWSEKLEVVWALLPSLLMLFWSLASFAAVVALLPIPQLQGFRNAVMLSACRGKLWEDRPRNALGRYTEWRVPQARFADFYALGSAAATFAMYIAFRHPGSEERPVIQSLCLLLFHLVRRNLETQYLMKYPVGSSMHVIAYIFGLAYYVVLPLSFLPPSFFVSPYVPTYIPESKKPHYLQSHSVKQKMGALVFLLGNALQFHSHRLLADLSKHPDKTPAAGSEHYKLPKEMIIYLGLTLTLNTSRILSWLPLIWVVSNLLLASGPTHRWYQRKFANYPKKRKAVIPFVY